MLSGVLVSSFPVFDAANNLDDNGSSFCFERPIYPIAYLCNATSTDCLLAFDDRPETFSSGPVLTVTDFSNMRCQASTD